MVGNQIPKARFSRGSRSCGCHPETCCCAEYYIRDEKAEPDEKRNRFAKQSDLIRLSNLADSLEPVLTRLQNIMGNPAALVPDGSSYEAEILKTACDKLEPLMQHAHVREKQLRRLSDVNTQAMLLLQTIRATQETVVDSGIACPQCGGELREHRDAVLTSLPPKYRLTCVHCGHEDYRIAVGS